MYARTVRDYVDPHVARLVDAVNTSPFDVRTSASCSGHYHKPGLPYLAFRTATFDFVDLLLDCTTALNRVTRGQTHIKLSSAAGGAISASVRLGMYPWLWAGQVGWGPLYLEWVKPPRRLARFWWAELDELARMIVSVDPSPRARFARCLEAEMDSELSCPSTPPRALTLDVEGQRAKAQVD